MIPALAGILLVLAALGTPGADKILLIGDRTFGDGERIVEALDAMVAASGVVGDTRFAFLPDADIADDDLVTMLQNRTDLRAIIAVVGDLSLLKGVDPNRDIPDEQHELTSREIDEQQLTAAMDRLADHAQRTDVQLVFATAPLGRQGRVEVPELLHLADVVRERTPVIDLADSFRELETASLFSNGIDELDAFGHEAAARVIFQALCRDESGLPPRDDEERAARATRRALDAWLVADVPRFQTAMNEAIQYPPTTRASAVQQAALFTARDGLMASCALWEAIVPPAGPCDTPGLPLARLLCRHAPTKLESRDPVESGILSIAHRILAGKPFEAWKLGMEFTAEQPNRPEAWITLEIASRAAGREGPEPETGCLASLRAVGCAKITETRVLSARRKDAGAALSLPVLLVAHAPYQTLTPTGPMLERLRREVHLGLHAAAFNIWQRDTRRLLIPPTWHAEAKRLQAAQEN